jgi:hypothetical protein
MSGTVKILGEEVAISGNNNSDFIMSGYMGYVGEVSSQYGGKDDKKRFL